MTISLDILKMMADEQWLNYMKPDIERQLEAGKELSDLRQEVHERDAEIKRLRHIIHEACDKLYYDDPVGEIRFWMQRELRKGGEDDTFGTTDGS